MTVVNDSYRENIHTIEREVTQAQLITVTKVFVFLMSSVFGNSVFIVFSWPLHLPYDQVGPFIIPKRWTIVIIPFWVFRQEDTFNHVSLMSVFFYRVEIYIFILICVSNQLKRSSMLSLRGKVHKPSLNVFLEYSYYQCALYF